MSAESIPTKSLRVDVQQNGLIRLDCPGHPLHGYIIARLNDTEFEALPDHE